MSGFKVRHTAGGAFSLRPLQSRQVAQALASPPHVAGAMDVDKKAHQALN
jgi:hypothetical protein